MTSIYRRDRINKREMYSLVFEKNFAQNLYLIVQFFKASLLISPIKLLLSCVYVPPNSSDTYYHNLFNHINTSSEYSESEFVIIADFNTP